MIANIVIKKLSLNDCQPLLLKNFNRYQEIENSWRKQGSTWILVKNPHILQWDGNQKSERLQGLIKCIYSGGAVVGAYLNNTLIGFASVSNTLFGLNNDSVQLEMLHVTFEYRNKGIGKLLFHEICKEAKLRCAKKLYISANSSEETTAFYKAAGCVETVEVNQELFTKEPFDCHLEYIL